MSVHHSNYFFFCLFVILEFPGEVDMQTCL